MKKIVFIVLSLMFISSFCASADDGGTFKKYNMSGWKFDKDLNQIVYYKNGDMIKNDWINLNNYWYYANSDGSIATGWAKLNNNWYYFTPSGMMVSYGWITIDGKLYYLNSDGTMAHDTYIGNYYVGSDGAWVK